MVFNEILAELRTSHVSYRCRLNWPRAKLKIHLPHKIATLLYCFDAQDRVLLMQRRREPNRGLWSPCGGKLQSEFGESPYDCACREANEEIGIVLSPADLRLIGIISEEGYQGEAHWLMFLFEVKPRLKEIPPAHDEGDFAFFTREELASVKMPATDAQQIWPLVWKHRKGYFAAHCRAAPNGKNEWSIEESRTYE